MDLRPFEQVSLYKILLNQMVIKNLYVEIFIWLVKYNQIIP